jgi:hypothetical protein
MFPYRRGGDAAGMGRRTSPSMTSILNLGKSPRVPIVRVPENNKEQEDTGKKSLPAKRDERDSRPSYRQIMRLLSMALFLRRGVRFGNDFGRQARIRTGGAVISFVRLQSRTSQKPLDVSRSNCVLQLTCSPGLERNLRS